MQASCRPAKDRIQVWAATWRVHHRFDRMDPDGHRDLDGRDDSTDKPALAHPSLATFRPEFGMQVGLPGHGSDLLNPPASSAILRCDSESTRMR